MESNRRTFRRDHDDVYAKWRRWLEAVHQDVLLLHHNLFVWREIADMVNENTEIPHGGFVLGWFTRLYVEAQLMGIRRLVDRHKDAVSLAKLLRDMADKPEVMSRERFRSLYRGEDEALGADGTYDSYAGPGCPTVPSAIVLQDLANLDEVSQEVETYADKTIAHRDRVPPESLTYGHLNRAIEVIGELHKRYYLLLTASSLWTVTPIIQEPWKGAFTVPWLKQ